MKKYIFIFVGLFFFCVANAQDQGLRLNTPDALESYTLFQGTGSKYYLINNCGEIVNSWTLIGVDLHPKILPNGNILYMSNSSSTIYEKDWDGNTVVSYVVENEIDLYLKYEVIKMPNGNYLTLARRTLTSQEFSDLGWNNDWGDADEVDVVIEYDPVLDDIVWEWNIIEHAIQQDNSSFDTYGIIKDHPELLDMAAISTYDWAFQESFMINGFDYNPELDQIALSVRKLGEVAIIDHSTTKEEARGHTGGKHGKGGDIIYRWGDPGNYGRATSDQQKELHLQHNPKWITSGIHKGKISIYNNNLNKVFNGVEPYSSAYIIDPPIDSDGFYILETDKPYGPITPTIRIDEPTTGTFFRSAYGSGVEVLPNENIFISNATGRLMEVSMDGEIFWEYQIPFSNFVFRCQKYSKDFPAFDGKDLEAFGQVPGAVENEECVVVSNENLEEIKTIFTIQYKANNKVLEVKNLQGNLSHYVLYRLDGKSLMRDQTNDPDFQVNLNNLVPGMYFISLNSEGNNNWESHKVMVF